MISVNKQLESCACTLRSRRRGTASEMKAVRTVALGLALMMNRPADSASPPAREPAQKAVWGSYSAADGRLLIVARWPDDPNKPALYDSVDDEFHHLDLDGDRACTEACSARLHFHRVAGSVTGVTVVRDGVATTARKDPLALSRMSFGSRGNRLDGRIWAPTTPGPHPAVLLMGGTGRNLRDDFRIYPYVFVRAGYVVYAFDKAGAGASGGDRDREEEGIVTLATDSEAALRALRRLPMVDSRRVGVLGISHGAWVSIETARMDPKVAFVAAIVGGGVPLWRATLFEAHNTLVRKGYSPEEVESGDELMASVFGALQDGEAEKVPALLKSSASQRWFADTPLAPFARLPDDVIVSVARVRWANELSYDPTQALRRLKVPILAIAGDKDAFVPGEQNLAAIRAAMGRLATTQLLPDANHWQAISDGRDFTYSPLLRPTLEKWLLELR